MARQMTQDEERRPISFPNWKPALAGAALEPAVKEAHRRAILTLLKFCKGAHAPVTVALIRSYLKTAAGPEAREALRWFGIKVLGSSWTFGKSPCRARSAR